MKRSQFMINTLKETPKEAAVISHVLMMRTCMIKQLTAGIYSYMPLALRSIRKIENIVRQELNAAGCQELLMPMVQPATLWEESGRWKDYGKELLRFNDRKDNAYCLGPTHEEVITDIARSEVRSYKDLPMNLYQIQTKFRDEIRPRFGLMRGREFIMKDAYSFDADAEGMDKSFDDMYEAYKKIFQRCDLKFRPVEADAGAIGGDFSREFHVLAGSGEDQIFSCTSCDYAANSERCEVTQPEALKLEATPADPQEVETPGRKTIEALSQFLKVEPQSCIKTLLYITEEGQLVGAVIPGHRELNEVALKNAIDCIALELATDARSYEAHGFCPGYLGPIGWPKDVPLFVDPEVMAMTSCVTGANKTDVHFTGVVPAHHFKNARVVTLRLAETGGKCPRCADGVFESYRGIEVGHIFKLGSKYSESMKATFLDTDGKEQVMLMGCYGLGIGRTMAAAIEQNHDDHGIIWPARIAPFHVMLLNLDIKDEQTSKVADGIYKELWSRGVETLLDDSPLRPGPKFKDADLIGLPLQVTVGARSLKNGVIELKVRRTGEKRTVPLEDGVSEIIEALKTMGWGEAPSGMV